MSITDSIHFLLNMQDLCLQARERVANSKVKGKIGATSNGTNDREGESSLSKKGWRQPEVGRGARSMSTDPTWSARKKRALAS